MEAPLRHRRAGLVAFLALAAQATGLFLPWWALQYADAESAQPLGSLGLWAGGGELARDGAVLVTAVLALAALPILLVRVAAASWEHEWRKWRRDLLVAAASQALALASCWAWPLEFPFWGTQERVSLLTGTPYTVSGTPALGWWLTAAAFALVLLAWGMSRPVESEPTPPVQG